MKKFEYLIKLLPACDYKNEELLLDNLGKDGFELISVVNINNKIGSLITYYFKREIDE